MDTKRRIIDGKDIIDFLPHGREQLRRLATSLIENQRVDDAIELLESANESILIESFLGASLTSKNSVKENEKLIHIAFTNTCIFFNPSVISFNFIFLANQFDFLTLPEYTSVHRNIVNHFESHGTTTIGNLAAKSFEQKIKDAINVNSISIKQQALIQLLKLKCFLGDESFTNSVKANASRICIVAEYLIKLNESIPSEWLGIISENIFAKFPTLHGHFPALHEKCQRLILININEINEKPPTNSKKKTI
jgi:hypothetical protein